MGRGKRSRGYRPHAEEKPVKRASNLSVVIDRMVQLKINHWVQKAKGEVSGLGKLVKQKDGSFRIIEAIMLPQENTFGSTELDANAVAKAMYLLMDTEGDLNWWWHSHGSLDTFWSQVDIDMMQEFAGSQEDQYGYCVATVFNHRGHMKSAFCVNTGKDKFLVDDIPTEIVSFLPAETFKKWDEEFEKNYKEKTFPAIQAVQSFGFDAEDGWERMPNGVWQRTEDAPRRVSALASIWLEPATYEERGQGWAIRYSAVVQGPAKLGIMPDGRVLVKTYGLKEEIPLADYTERNTLTSRPHGVEHNDPHPNHPLLRGTVADGLENDIATLRENIRGLTVGEILALAQTGKLSEAELEAIWHFPEMERLDEVQSWDDEVLLEVKA